MTNEQVLAIYNLAKDERVKHTSIMACKEITPHISVLFGSGVTSDEAIGIIGEIFSDAEKIPTSNPGQYYGVKSHDVCFFVADEWQGEKNA